MSRNAAFQGETARLSATHVRRMTQVVLDVLVLKDHVFVCAVIWLIQSVAQQSALHQLGANV